MGTLNLRTDNDARYADNASKPDVKEHQQIHDALARLANEFDVDAVPQDGYAWVWSAANGCYIPTAVTGGGGSGSPSTTLQNAAPGSIFRVVYAGGWPGSRPSTRTDIFFDLTGAPANTPLPGWLIVGDGSSSQKDIEFDSRLDALEAAPSGSGSGITDHGQLSGLGDDDHTQYLTAARGDARYYSQATTDTKLEAAASKYSGADRTRGNHSGTQLAATISDFTSAVQAVPGFGGSGGGGGTADALRVPATNYGTFQYLTGSETSAQIESKLSANDAIFYAALDANPDKWVVGPNQYVPSHMVRSSSAGMLDARLLQVPGTTGALGSTNGYASRAALEWENPCGAAQAVTVGTWQIGTNQPSGLIFTQTVSNLVLPTSSTAGKKQGDLARYRQGDVGEIYCQKGYGWSSDAIASPPMTSTVNVWTAEAGEVHGIGMLVTSFAYPSGVTNMERRRVTGQSSGATAIINGFQLDATGGTAGRMIFPSVSKDFDPGENLVDVDSGAVVGVVGQMSLVIFGRFDFFYPSSANPQFRLMQQKTVRLRIDVKTAGDPEVFLPPADRNPSLIFTGLYYPDIEYRVDNVTSRGAIVRSCFMGEVRYEAHGISNHALGSGAYLEQGYGYGCETRGFIFGTRFRALGSELRHLFTTNPNARTYESDGTAHLDYGCGGQRLVISGDAADCFAAAFDNHEGCFGLIYRACTTRRNFGGGRSLTDGVGFNNRGHGTLYDDCESDGAWVGFREQGAQSQAGIKHTITYRDCRSLNYQNRGWLCNGSYDGTSAPAQGLSQDGVTALGVYATVSFEGTLARGDGQTGGNPYFQCGYEFGWGAYRTFNIRSERFGGLPFWIKGMTTTNGVTGAPKVGGWHEWYAPVADYSEGAGNNPARLDAELETFTIYGGYRIRTKVSSGSPVPAYCWDSKQGATVLRHEGVRHSSTGDASATTNGTSGQAYSATSPGPTTIAAPTMLTVSAGAATAVDIRPAGGTSNPGQDGAPGANGIGFGGRPQIGQALVSRSISAATATALSTTQNRTTLYPQEYLAGATYDAVVTGVTVAMAGGAGVAVKVAIYKDDGSGTWPDTASAPLVTLDLTTAVGTTGIGKITALSATWTPPTSGIYWHAVYFGFTTAPTTPPTMQCIGGATFSLSQATSTFPNKPKAYARTGDTDLPATACTTTNTVGITSNDAPIFALRRSA